jgi:hypothetical protein
MHGTRGLEVDFSVNNEQSVLLNVQVVGGYLKSGPREEMEMW